MAEADSGSVGEPESGTRRTRGPRRFWRWSATVIGVALVAADAAGVAAHYSPLVSSTASRVAAFSPVLILAGMIGLLVVAGARRWILTAVAAVIVAVGVISQAPFYVGDSDARDSDVAVMQANIYLGRADVGALAQTVRDEGVDVLTVVELTEAALRGFQSSELAELLPYSYTSASEGGTGVGIFSRYPLSNAKVLDHYRLGNLRVETDIPGHGRVAVYALHPLPPWPEPAWHWNSEIGRLGSTLAAEKLPTIIGADMNSTPDHRPFRDLLRGSSHADSPQLVDAAEHVGAGWTPTYPANSAVPPLLAIDHILTRGGPTPTSFRTVTLSGSDHRAVIATVR